ncbi:hypothetical protein ACOZ7N_004549, partial [Yersinia enterocolitica]|nr:hypothetical protein [Yersinia enterocolitica]HDL7478224.1 hypothetical protein [Yersinia enterocolitica]
MSHFLKGLSAEIFNQKYPVGSRFNYFSVKGIPDSVEVVTRTEAWALGHGDVVVSVNGRAGGLHIEHMKPIVLADSLQQNLEELKGDHVPVAWTDAEELRGMAKDGCGYLFKVDPAKPFTDPRRQIMLFTAAQKPVVLPERYSCDCGVCADPNGEWVAVDEIIEAIKAAGGTVEGK